MTSLPTPAAGQHDRPDLVVRVPIDSVQPAPENNAIYHAFDIGNEDDNELYESVKQHGVLDPLTVSMDDFILSGHRRHWAASIAGLGHVPIRREDIFFADQSEAERLRILTEYNTQRRKGAEEQVREEIVRASPKDAFRHLRERLEAKQAETCRPTPSAMRIEGRMARSAISKAKTAFLQAVRDEIETRRTYWPLSVRQIHYALLNDPPLRHSSKPASGYQNDRKSYKSLCDLCTRARLEGLLPWAAINDETRPVELWSCHATVADYVAEEARTLFGYYRRDLLQSQTRHVEVACEKNTVADIVRRVAYDYGIPVTSGRGYCSVEPRRQMAKRHAASGKPGHVLILISDCDPDGDEIAGSMARSVRDDFDVENVVAVRAALTYEQAQHFALPPNANAKTSSPQFKKYFARHGTRNAYELEALPPDVLAGMVRSTIESVIDMAAYRRELEIWEEEAAEIEVIRQRAVAAIIGKPCK